MLRIILQVTERQGHFMKKYVMALDQGTTSSRCILFDREGQICSMAQKEFEQSYPKPGITDALEGDSMNNDLRTILGGLHQENPREMAEALLQIVLHKTGGHIRDDMTVLVFGIWENV